MPKNKSAAVRYRAIDKRIRRKFKPYPTIEDLIQTVEEVTEESISKSSIQKDIHAMKHDPDLGFNAPIEFSRQHKGYYYADPDYSIDGIPLDENEISAIEFAAGIISQFRGTDFTRDFEDALDKIMAKVNLAKHPEPEKIIQVEKGPQFTGSEFILPLIEFIRNRDVIKFTYTKFTTDSEETHIVHPYLIKEYRNRWYLTGYHNEHKEIRTFGLDRIGSIEPTKQIAYFQKPGFDPDVYFKYAFGITRINNEEPEHIELQFSPFQGKYFKTQPIHETQEILNDNTDEFRIRIKVIPSIELISFILSYGKDVKVIKPEWLVNEVQSRK